MTTVTHELTLPPLGPDSDEILQVACEAALEGGQIVAGFFAQEIHSRSKEGEASYNLVTDADVASERAMVARIRRAFPQHAILAEEEAAGAGVADDLWIIDPLDGTNNFAHHIPHFAICVAYYRNGQPHCGVVFNPVRGDWYWASAAGPAYHNGRRLQVSAATNLSQVLVGCGFFYDRGAMMEATLKCIAEFFGKEIHGIRRFGTASLDFCHVACGAFGAFFEYQLQPWDFAAARLIVERAGGKVTTGRGEPLPLRMTSVLATNTYLHERCLEIVARHHP
ncbi:MAG: inositol monophosphatase [Pirellulaceae bacterium]|nr:MAG: inositol monophosphatase [Pirellulaceae bacterium]